MKDQIELATYDPHWPALASTEIFFLKTLLPLADLEFEHIGSTAISGLSAKPVIDLMVGVRSLADAGSTIEPLEQNGYSYWRDNPFKEHFFFVKGLPLAGGAGRTHHLHVVQRDSGFWRDQITFRDHLRNHAEDALAYQQLKLKLADQFRNDRDGYTNAKTDFVKAVLERAYASGAR